MKGTKSKLNLVELQAQFDKLLEQFSSDDILIWKQKDLQSQKDALFNGQSIEVESNPISYIPISCEINNGLCSILSDNTSYALAA